MRLISWNVNGLRACVGKGFEDYAAAAGAVVDLCLCAAVGAYFVNVSPTMAAVFCVVKVVAGRGELDVGKFQIQGC